MPSLNLVIEPIAQAADYQMVKFDGELDKVGFSEVRGKLDEAINTFSVQAEAVKFLVFDLGNLKFINSEAIGYLVEVYTHLLHSKKKLVLVAANAHVKDVFQAIGINTIVPNFDSFEAFLSNKPQ